MQEVTREKLNLVMETLRLAEKYEHVCHVLNFDMETVCPPKGREDEGELIAYFESEGFRFLKAPVFQEAAEYLYVHQEELEEFDRILAQQLHRSYLHTKNITPEKMRSFSEIRNRAYVRWLEAKQASDFNMFAPSLREVVEINREEIGLREEDEPGLAKASVYDRLLDDYERGMTADKLDSCFAACKERLIPLLKRIQQSPKKIRTDFLSRYADPVAQARLARRLLEILDFDFSRGGFATTEHPFTDWIGRNDTRITTHYYEEAFLSSIYSVIHECGHALFDMLQPRENKEHFIAEGKTMGMHESVSRFYENRIGRSEAFIHLLYPVLCEILPEVMEGVTERELYEAVNRVHPTLVRTEADEFTYTFHIIIRYEIEKLLAGGEVQVEDVPELWKQKYREYLGVEPEDDREGALQDVHWSFGLGYFPAYALGNMYNAMYYRRMEEELDLDSAVERGDFALINQWMAQNVFRKADRLKPAEWILDLTGRELTPDDFLDYLEEKYTRLYELDGEGEEPEHEES